MHTFFLEPELWNEPYQLTGAEAHHAGRVLRLRPGEEIRLIDGEGRTGVFSIDEIAKTFVTLIPLSIRQTEPPAVQCTLAAGFSKALRRGWFLEKAVELEAAAIWFWQGDYSQAALPDVEKAGWKGALVAGAKQSANPWLPDMVALKGGVDGLIRTFGAFDRVFLLYEGDTKGSLLTVDHLSQPGKILLIIGPEGGFSPAEAEKLIRAGARAVSLGDRVLRWETAAVLTLGLAWWARQK